MLNPEVSAENEYEEKERGSKSALGIHMGGASQMYPTHQPSMVEGSPMQAPPGFVDFET